MLTPSRGFLLSPRFFALPAVALGVIIALAQAAQEPKRVEAKAAGPVRKAPCAPGSTSQAPERDPACRLAEEGSTPRILR